MTDIKKISVIGAGLMGYGISQIAAQYGYEVILCDISKDLVDKAIESISNRLETSVEKGLLTENEKYNLLSRIHGTINLEEAALNAEFIIEAVTENKAIKKNLLKKISNLASDNTIIVTNTSSIKITDLAIMVTHPENFCGMHFFNPPQLIELVEIVRGELTSDATIQTVLEVSHKLLKETVVLKKDCPGFIVNRILLPALNEAADLYYSGVAEKEDIDKAIKLGLKWPIGPLMLIDQIGVDTVVAIGEVLGQDLDSRFYPIVGLKDMKESHILGKKTGKGFYEWTKKE
jgi:3-hydroxybutyryl-CoA dehydrogenase